MYSSTVKPRHSLFTAKKYRSIELGGGGGGGLGSEKGHGSSAKSKKSSSKSKISFYDHLSDYLANTSLHGLKYVGDINITYVERLFFLVSFIIVTVMSGYFISNIWEKWSETPVIISLNPTATPLKKIPFPAVTICNMNQAKKSVANKIKPETLEHSLLQSVCSGKQQINISNDDYQGKWSSFKRFLLDVTEPCNKIIIMCRFAGIRRNCSAIFDSVLTDEGICCSFNTVAERFMFHTYDSSNNIGYDLNDDDIDLELDWTPENGFPPEIDPDMYPQPIPGTGSNLGLSVVLDAKVYDYYCSSTNGAGFKVLLHNPIETPKIADFGFSVATGKETRIALTPRISDASNLIRRIPKYQRQCIFANEANLTYFRTYSKKNCEMECESRLIEAECGCVLYYMPRITEDPKICSRKDAACYEQINLAIDLSNNDSYTCSCLPGCFEIGYLSEISTAPLSNGTFMIHDHLLDKYKPQYVQANLALLHFYVIDSSFRAFTKGELIGFTEFLSSTGGLLGLFMGFSVLSIIEIIYFLTIRSYCLRKQDAKRDVLEQNGLRLGQTKHEEIIEMNISHVASNVLLGVKQNLPTEIKDEHKIGDFIQKNFDSLKTKITNTGILKASDTKEFGVTVPKYPYYD